MYNYKLIPKTIEARAEEIRKDVESNGYIIFMRFNDDEEVHLEVVKYLHERYAIIQLVKGRVEIFFKENISPQEKEKIIQQIEDESSNVEKIRLEFEEVANRIIEKAKKNRTN